MRLNEKLRHIWHELFYNLTPPSGEKFAMTCKEAVEQMEVRDDTRTWISWLRLKLHVSLCQACNNYFVASRSLARAIRKVIAGARGIDLEKTNRELVEKHARK